MASNSVRPGDLRLLEGSPPSRCLTTSVVFLSMPTLLTPATYLPSHFTRNLKFLYGSKRVALTLNWAMISSLLNLDLSGELLDLDDHKLCRLERRKPDEDVDDAFVNVVLSGRLFIALHQIGLTRRLSLKCTLTKQALHESTHVQAYLSPER